MGKSVPGTWEYVIEGFATQSSVAVTENVAIALHAPGAAFTTTLEGQSIVGAELSMTTTVELPLVALHPLPFVTVTE